MKKKEEQEKERLDYALKMKNRKEMKEQILKVLKGTPCVVADGILKDLQLEVQQKSVLQ